MIVRRSTRDRQVAEARADALVQARSEVFQQLAVAQGARPALRMAEALGWIEKAEDDGDEIRVRWRR